MSVPGESNFLFTIMYACIFACILELELGSRLRRDYFFIPSGLGFIQEAEVIPVRPVIKDR